MTAAERWHPIRDLVGLPGILAHRTIRHRAATGYYISRRIPGDKRDTLQILESSLPEETQAALRARRGEEAPADELSVRFQDDLRDARLEVLMAFRRWRASSGLPRDRAMKAWVPLYKASGADVSAESRAIVTRLSWNTLRKWFWRFEKYGSAGLADQMRPGRTSGIEANPELRDYIEAKIRNNPNHITAKNIRRAVAAKFPDRETPSISAIQRWSRRWRAANGFELSANADPDGHRSRTMPAFGSESEAITALNDVWEFDSTRIDVMCADGRRHALVAAIDVWSRRGKIVVTPQSRSTAIAALIRRCLLDWGVPDWIRTDEGADYTSKHLRRVFAELNILHDVCPPYRPDKKPFIERFIGTVSRDLFTEMEGFTGHNVAEAQKLRERKSFAARRGEEWTVTFRCGLTAEQLQKYIDAWCDTLYGREPHSGTEGMSPFEKAASWTGERRRVAERGLDVLLAPSAGDGRRKVGKSGIRVDGGLYIAGELGKHTGAWVHVRQDPADLGRIFVFTEPDKKGPINFICIAEDPVRTGIDRQAVAAEAKRNWRARNNSARKRTRELEREHRPADSLEAVLSKAAEDASTVVAFPAAGALHSTDALDAAAEAEAADEAAEKRTRRDRMQISLFKKFYGEPAPRRAAGMSDADLFHAFQKLEEEDD